MLNDKLQKLAEALNLTEYQELEPYILTPEEEELAIVIAINQAKNFFGWKIFKILKSEDDVISKVNTINWEGKIDREQVLAQANSIKLQDQWHKKQRAMEKEEVIKKQKDLQEYWTYARIFQLMKLNSENRFGNKLMQDEQKMPAIKAICFFVSRDDRFINELGYDSQKGLLIRGPTGTGKTHLVRCVEDNPLNPILTLSMLDIVDKIKADGEFKINIKGEKLIYLDDVGTEEAIVNHYGTKVSWFKNFIEGIYLKTKCFNHLIITTNLNFKGMEDHYGVRVASRMREMFNVIDLNGEDLRNKKISCPTSLPNTP